LYYMLLSCSAFLNAIENPRFTEPG
jgi:hypothetical protein